MQIACDTKCDLELHDCNSAVGTESMIEQLCLIKVLQMAILEHIYSSEWKRVFKINLVSVCTEVPVVLSSAKTCLKTWGLSAKPVETLNFKELQRFWTWQCWRNGCTWWSSRSFPSSLILWFYHQIQSSAVACNVIQSFSQTC